MGGTLQGQIYVDHVPLARPPDADLSAPHQIPHHPTPQHRQGLAVQFAGADARHAVDENVPPAHLVLQLSDLLRVPPLLQLHLPVKRLVGGFAQFRILYELLRVIERHYRPARRREGAQNLIGEQVVHAQGLPVAKQGGSRASRIEDVGVLREDVGESFYGRGRVYILQINTSVT